MREDAQLNGIQFGGDLGSRSLAADRYLHVAARRDRRAAIGLDQKCAQAVHYDRRSVNRLIGRQGAQLVHFGLLVAVLEIDHGSLVLLKKRDRGFNVSMDRIACNVLAFSSFGGSLEEGKTGSSSISVFPVPLILTSFTRIFRLGIVKPNSV